MTLREVWRGTVAAVTVRRISTPNIPEEAMREAVIVSTARTALTKAGRGALNDTHGITMAGHVIKGALERAGVEAAAVEDVFLGCAAPEGATGHNVA
ncbi:MAG: hypothetical protein Q8L84_09720, partial [Hyphomonas sp.]|nr:hypothetical protein [Hyphomonas sp.]